MNPESGRRRGADSAGDATKSGTPDRAEVIGHLLIALGTFILYYWGGNDAERKD